MLKKLKTDNSYLNTGLVLLIDVLASVCASGAVLFLISILAPTISFTRPQTVVWLSTAFIASSLTFYFGRVYRSIIRYSTIRGLRRFSLVCVAKEALMYGTMALGGLFSAGSGLLVGMVVIDLLGTMVALIAIRVMMLVVYDRMRSRLREDQDRQHVLVYGLSDLSTSLAGRLRNSAGFVVEGFLAPGASDRGHEVDGHPVYYYTEPRDLGRVKGVDGVLFAQISEVRRLQDTLLDYCQKNGIKIYIAPEIDEITSAQSLGKFIRKIKIEDLLGRPEIEISLDDIKADMNGKTVLVTGAAGSIGSELCRQLARFGVRRLILFDNAETPLHNIRLELEDTFPELDFLPVIGDVRSRSRLDYVFRDFRPQIVFHAAAYKHVPLMEENPCEAVHVNVVGSRTVADKCIEYDVEKMVMVSTDKAVNPTNIMGCTKRIAEIYVQSLGLAVESGERKGRTRFVTTRFGNVLGSNGSVIPRFREQIQRGGPITVTHPDIRRFFMTIPEACRLVLEAASFASGTQIFVFDMGESVRIATLAERMITLAGMQPGRDIKIEYTGLRPGEKLYEEVLATKENTLPTHHERIYVAKVRHYDIGQVDKVLEEMTDLMEKVKIRTMVRLMKRFVPEFKSNHSRFEELDAEVEAELRATHTGTAGTAGTADTAGTAGAGAAGQTDNTPGTDRARSREAAVGAL